MGASEPVQILINSIGSTAVPILDGSCLQGRLHTYEGPEILGLPIDRGDSDYLAWLRSQLSDSGAADSNF